MQVNLNPLGNPAANAMYMLLWNESNLAIAGGGDSGSAVIETYSEERASPAGQLYGGASTLYNENLVQPCTGVPEHAERYCTSIAYVSPWPKIRTALAVTELTTATLW